MLPADVDDRDADASLERAFAGASVSYERRERKSTGEMRWVRVTLFPDREISGRTGGAFVVLNDIEDDVRIRDALKGQQSQLRAVRRQHPRPDRLPRPRRCATRSSTRRSRTSPRGRRRRSTAARPPRSCRPTSPAFLRPVLKRAQEGENVEYERIGTLPGGDKRWMHGRIAPDFDGAGKVRGLYCTEYDIHDLKLTEQALATREQQLRLFTDNIPEPVVYLDHERRYVFVNEAFLRLYGLKRDEVIGRRSDEVLGNEATEALAPGRQRVMSGEAVTYEREVIDAQGRTRWIRARCVPDLNFDGTVKGEYVAGHDITDLKLAQDALAARESQLRAIMDGVPAPVAYIDRDERCHYVNRAFVQFFGLTPERARRPQAARRRRPRHLRERAGDGRARARRRVDGVRPADRGRQRRQALDDDPRRAGHRRRRARFTARSC